MPPEQAYVGPSWAYVGGLCWPLCWGQGPKWLLKPSLCWGRTLSEGRSSPQTDSQATGGSENAPNMKLAGHWGEVEDRQIFDKQFTTEGPRAPRFEPKRRSRPVASAPRIIFRMKDTERNVTWYEYIGMPSKAPSALHVRWRFPLVEHHVAELGWLPG